MTEHELRHYIRKEILLNEEAGDMSAQDVSQIWDAFADVFRVAKTAVKSLLSVLVLNVKLVFLMDPRAREEAKREYQSRRSQIESEYSRLLGPTLERFKSVEPLLFLAYPGAYIGYELAKSGGSNFAEIREFFQQIGIDITDMRIPTSLGDTGGEGKGSLGMLYGFFGGGTPGTKGALSQLANQQEKIQSSLDRIFGLMQSGVRESVLLEQKSDSIEDQIGLFFKEVVAKSPPEAFKVDAGTEKSIVALKSAQAKKYVSDLEAPVKFLQKLSQAKTVSDVKSALSILSGTPFTLQGVDKLTPEYLESAAQNVLKVAEKKKKVKDLFEEIGIEIPESREEQVDAVKAYQMKNLLGGSLMSVKSSFSKQLESLRKSYIEELQEDVDFETLKRIAPGSDLEKVMTLGLQNIREAGKR